MFGWHGNFLAKDEEGHKDSSSLLESVYLEGSHDDFWEGRTIGPETKRHWPDDYTLERDYTNMNCSFLYLINNCSGPFFF